MPERYSPGEMLLAALTFTSQPGSGSWFRRLTRFMPVVGEPMGAARVEKELRKGTYYSHNCKSQRFDDTLDKMPTWSK
jgi:hypothetical protein